MSSNYQGAPGYGVAQGERPAPPATAPTPVRPAVRRTRLSLSRLDIWSVTKVSFLFSVALGIALIVSLIVLWLILDGMGIFDKVNGLIGEVAGSENQNIDVLGFLSLGRVASFGTVIAVVDVVLITAMSLLAAIIYNLAAVLVGGLGITLSDE